MTLRRATKTYTTSSLTSISKISRHGGNHNSTRQRIESIQKGSQTNFFSVLSQSDRDRDEKERNSCRGNSSGSIPMIQCTSSYNALSSSSLLSLSPSSFPSIISSNNNNNINKYNSHRSYHSHRQSGNHDNLDKNLSLIEYASTLRQQSNSQQAQAQAQAQLFVEEMLVMLSSWLVKVPKGFENFFPKNTKGSSDVIKKSNKDSTQSESPKSSSSSKPEPKDENTEQEPQQQQKQNQQSAFANYGKNKDKGDGSKSYQNFQSNNNNNNNKNNDPNEERNQMAITAALLFLVLFVRQMLEDEMEGGPGNNGREITWVDFYNHVLERGDVDRIVVINKKMARVYLRPGARGVPLTQEFASMSRRGTLGSGSDPSMSGSNTNLGSQRMRSSKERLSSDGNNSWDGDESSTMDFGSSQPALSSISSPQSKPQHQQQLIYHFHIGSVESFEEKLTRAQRDLNIHTRDYVPVQYANETNWALELLRAAPALLMMGMVAYAFRSVGGMGGMPGAGGRGGGGGPGGIFSVGKSNAKKVNKEDISINFSHVAGCQEAKKEIMEFVDFLKDSTRFTKLGAKIPKGALLCGPPGTGKTLLAKAVAGEAGVPFFSISGSDFIEMFVGVGPSRVRDLFKEARAASPCIVFIDEIDAVGRKRGRGGFSGGNDERENTLNQLLVEMDGFNPSEGVVVLAGTNRVDILDEALTRPGRFDRQITVDRPDLQGRKEIFLVHLKGITLEGTPDDIAGRLAGLTPGFAGADIANICNEAAIVAARRSGEYVTMEDFEKATDRIIGGLESTKIMSKEERNVVAHHEAGHAIAGWFLEHADPLLKVTIVPRSSGALGFAQYLPKEVFLRTQEQIMHIVCMALAGRAAEEVFFGKVTTGASDDLRRVTDLVYSIIRDYGMNPKVGQLAFPKDPNAGPGDKPYSDYTAETMDDEARRIVDEAYQRTVDLITEKKEAVGKVADLLLEKETINHDDIYDLVGPRPSTNHDAYNEYVSSRNNDNNNVVSDKKEQSTTSTDTNDDVDKSSGFTPTPGLAFKC